MFNSLTIQDADIEKLPSTVVVSGVAAAYSLALKATQMHGQVVAIGVPRDNIPVSILSLILNDQTLVATNQGSNMELVECLKIAVEHGIKPVYELKELDQINEGYQAMIDGKVMGRLVYRIS